MFEDLEASNRELINYLIWSHGDKGPHNLNNKPPLRCYGEEYIKITRSTNSYGLIQVLEKKKICAFIIVSFKKEKGMRTLWEDVQENQF
ncbi:MAG: hypothetical protein NZ530_02315 [Thermodesulfobacteriaceae bacterium]|nr:hypothetical protein [Thermodesulfobacteriaceae bacterium]MCX8042306.1 hypothetical protein [Thermodesulfobacteriaceae bacterium]MDW8135610.1 hypothetical protein [Thermodesulfobacterium sp.]